MDRRAPDPRVYEVRVSGRQPPRDLLDELGDTGVVEHEVVTVLSGRFPDQAALYGFLSRLRGFGLEVVEVRRLPGPEEARAPGGDEAEEAAGSTDEEIEERTGDETMEEAGDER
jgi:hypothetical protein